MSWPGILSLLQSGLGNLAAYLAAHVLLCLVPAFFIAGGLAALVPKEAVTRFLGQNAPRFASLQKATDCATILGCPLVSTPCLVMNGKVFSSPRSMPNESDALSWMATAPEKA